MMHCTKMKQSTTTLVGEQDRPKKKGCEYSLLINNIKTKVDTNSLTYQDIDGSTTVNIKNENDKSKFTFYNDKWRINGGC